MYDWGNSAFVTSIMAAILPVYFYRVAAADLPGHLRTAYWGYTQTVAVLVIALMAPLLGTAGDRLGARKAFLAFFTSVGILGSFLLYFVVEGSWKFAAAAFIIGYIGYSGGEIFYESLLPHIARKDEIDRVSTAGYALGYVGGGLLLAVHLAWISWPESFGMPDAGHATRVALASVGAWWAIFSIPILRTVAEPTTDVTPGRMTAAGLARTGFQHVVKTLREFRRYRHAFVFLLAFWIYNDGVITIIKMATIYGAELGIGEQSLIGALVLVQFLGIPSTLAYGALAGRLGSKNGIYLALAVYTAISLAGYFMSEAWHFWALACLVAMVQGGCQALSRSLFATLVPIRRSAEFFGFFAISGKFGNILGPFLFGLISHVSGSSRLSILTLSVFFLGGALLLSRVDIAEGRRAAQTDGGE